MLSAAFCATPIMAVTGADAAPRVSAPLPPLSSVVLAPSDFRPGATVLSERNTAVSGFQTFMRVFKPGATFSGPPLLGAVSIALVAPDATTAVFTFKGLEGAAQSVTGRNALAKQWGTDFVRGANIGTKGRLNLTVKNSVVGAPVEIGANALRLPLTLKTNLGTIRMSIELAQTDRIIGIVMLMGEFNQRLVPGDTAKALAAEERHLRDAFTITNTTAPTIAGTAAQGQMVTLDAGSWTGAPSTFTYAWSRCDASGGNCVAIAGATASSYTVTSTDVGSTLRGTVTGANSVSSAGATSTATAAVS
jgi:hypothetical protein